MPDFKKMTLEELALAGGTPASLDTQAVEHEFLRRQTIAMQESAEYQKAKADEETKISEEMKTQSQLMMWTVIAIAVAAIVQAGAAIFAAYHVS